MTIIKKTIIVIACVFLLLIGYKVYITVRSEPYADDSIAYEIYNLLRDNGYDVVMEDGVEMFNDAKAYNVGVRPEMFENLDLHEIAENPEVFFINIHLYSTENDAIIKTGQFGPKGDVYLDDLGRYHNLGFHTAPRCLRSGNAIIFYLGVDTAVLELLIASYGKQFAGS